MFRSFVPSFSHVTSYKWGFFGSLLCVYIYRRESSCGPEEHVLMLWLSMMSFLVILGSILNAKIWNLLELLLVFPSSQIRRLSALDSAWVTSTTNGLQGHAHPAWLHLYLATCKLLHLALILPATRLPQFQMYRWAFVGDDNSACDGDISSSSRSIQQQVTPNFVPYLTRIYRLLRNKVSLISLPHFVVDT